MTTTAIQDEPAPKMAVSDWEARLREEIGSYKSAIVALSGGVDSSLLAFIAQDQLGDRALAVTGLSPSLAQNEERDIRSFCEQFQIHSRSIDTKEMDNPKYKANAPDRCFFCKDELYFKLRSMANKLGYDRVLDGTHIDDLKAHRPSLKAAEDHSVTSPFIELGMNKMAIRELSRKLGLPQSERPSAPCLSSRVAYGIEVTPEKLQQVEQAEHMLSTLGFTKLRVRHHDSIARIEIMPSEFMQAIQNAESICDAVKAAGFTYVTLDLAGFRSGSLLEILKDNHK